MNEYGNTKSLIEILEDLAFYCSSRNILPNIKVVLPRAAIEDFSNSMKPKEREVLVGEPPKDNTVGRVYTSFNGRVELFSSEDNEVTMKSDSV